MSHVIGLFCKEHSSRWASRGIRLRDLLNWPYVLSQSVIFRFHVPEWNLLIEGRQETNDKRDCFLCAYSSLRSGPNANPACLCILTLQTHYFQSYFSAIPRPPPTPSSTFSRLTDVLWWLLKISGCWGLRSPQLS